MFKGSLIAAKLTIRRSRSSVSSVQRKLSLYLEVCVNVEYQLLNVAWEQARFLKPVWNWEQGRLDYFQFDELRKIARCGLEADLRNASREELSSAIGLPFLPDNPKYLPWRNYKRLFQIAMIAVPFGQTKSRITEVGRLLAR